MIKEMSLIFMRKLIETRRNPIYILMLLANPTLYLLFFYPLLKNLGLHRLISNDSVLTFFVPGVLTMIAAGGLFVGFGTVSEVRSGIIERFRVTPLRRLSILIGMVLQNVVITLASALFLIAICIPFNFHGNLLGMILVFLLLILLVASTASFSHTMAFIVQREDKLAPIIHGLNMPLTLLSGIMLPMNLAPNWLKNIAYINPLYHVVEASRHLVVGNFIDPSIGYAFFFMISVTGLIMWWSTRIFNKIIV
jgi:ABC-2 type transport system permease protein